MFKMPESQADCMLTVVEDQSTSGQEPNTANEMSPTPCDQPSLRVASENSGLMGNGATDVINALAEPERRLDELYASTSERDITRSYVDGNGNGLKVILDSSSHEAESAISTPAVKREPAERVGTHLTNGTGMLESVQDSSGSNTLNSFEASASAPSTPQNPGQPNSLPTDESMEVLHSNGILTPPPHRDGVHWSPHHPGNFRNCGMSKPRTAPSSSYGTEIRGEATQRRRNGRLPPRMPALLQAPVLCCADHHSITLEWAEWSGCTWYLDLSGGPEKPEPRLNKQQIGRLKQPLSLPRSPGNTFRVQPLSHGVETLGTVWPEWAAVYCGKERMFKVDGLRPGKNYFFRLRAVPVGYPPSVALTPSPTAVFGTLPSVPDAPSAVALVTSKCTMLKVAWSPPNEQGGYPITQFGLEMRPAPHRGDGGSVAHNAEGFTSVYKGPDSMVSVNGLKPGTEYTFRCKALNRLGSSCYSPLSSFTTLAHTPLAPLAPTPTAVTASSITLAWKEPHSGGAPILSYKLQLDDGGERGFYHVYSGPNRSCEVRGLKCAFMYSFRLQALNDEGCSPFSPVVQVSTSLAPPQAPCQPHITNIEPEKAEVHWSAPEIDGGSPIVRYMLELSGDGKGVARAEWEVLYEGCHTDCSLERLQPGHHYRVRVQAVNAMGTSPYSVETAFCTPPGLPTAMLAPHMKASGKTSIDLEWRPPFDTGGLPISEYQVEMQLLELREAACNELGKAVSLGWQNSSNVVVVAEGCGFQSCYRGPLLNAHVDSLSPGCCYAFRARALNSLGAGPWSPLSAMDTHAAPPLAPEAPVLALACTPTSITLRWTCPSSQGAPIVTYRLQMWNMGYDRKSSGGNAPLLALAGSGNSNSNSEAAGALVRSSSSSSMAGAPFTFTASSNCSSEAEADAVGGNHACFSAAGDSWHEGRSDASSMEGSIPAQVYEDAYHGPALAHTVMRLHPSTSYSFRVQAINRVGAGPFSPPFETSTAPDVPLAPPAPVVMQSEPYDVHLQWEVPDRDNGSPVMEYIVQMALDARAAGGSTRLQNSLSASTSGLSSLSRALPTHSTPPSPGMSPSRSHRRKLGAGARSASMNSMLPLENPPTPLSRRIPLPVDAWKDVFCGPHLECWVGQLQSGQRYGFRVLARNALGTSPPSPLTWAVTARAVPPPPPAPRASRVGPSSIHLNWSPTDLPHGRTVDLFQLSRDNGQGGTLFKVYEGLSTDYVDTSLMPGHMYRFQLQAHNDEGWSAPTEVRLSTLPAPRPQPPVLQVLQAGKSAFTLCWAAVALDEEPGDAGEGASLGPVRYMVEMKEAGAVWSSLYEGPAIRCSTGSLEYGKTYCFRARVQGRHERMASTWSGSVSVRVQASNCGPPPLLAASGGQVATAWSCFGKWTKSTGQVAWHMMHELAVRRSLAVAGTFITIVGAYYGLVV